MRLGSDRGTEVLVVVGSYSGLNIYHGFQTFVNYDTLRAKNGICFGKCCPSPTNGTMRMAVVRVAVAWCLHCMNMHEKHRSRF